MHRGLARTLAAVITTLFLAVPASAAEFDHSDLDGYLRKIVVDSSVDYKKAARLYPLLQGYLKRVATFDPQKLSSSEAKLAFYANAYNAYVLQEVLQNRRPRSVKEVPGFFDKKQHRVAGELLTLNELEDQKLRSAGDPRVHFILSCAARSCPPLYHRAFTPERWSADLELRTTQFLARRGEVVVDNSNKTITVVKLFDWYEQDWGGERAAREFIAKYVPAEAVPLRDESYTLKTREYDWSLNAR